MIMLDKLREATRVQHQELEEENLANKIMDHSISLEQYKDLLFQNYVAYKAAEGEIKEYLPEQVSNKAETLQKDLQNLEVSGLDYKLDFTCNSEAEAIGAAYVIEGSAMGGMLIGKEVSNCEHLQNLPEQEFFNGRRDNIKSWNQFLKFIRSREFSEAEKEHAAAKAQETFELFGRAFKIERSTIA